LTGSDRAADAPANISSKIARRLPSSPKGKQALGREAYLFFLKNVALYRFPRKDFGAGATGRKPGGGHLKAMSKERNKNVRPLQLAKRYDTWIKKPPPKELQISQFLDKHGILTWPVGCRLPSAKRCRNN